ncbi:MAG: DUF1573 domain-containing protein [Patescibacteria group bacterium]
MQKIVLTLALAILVVGGLAGLKAIQPQKTSSVSASAGLLKLDENFYDFGKISMAAGKVSHEFKIVNSGTEPLKIEKIYTSCMCTNATLEVGGRKFGPYGMPGHGFVPRVGKEIGPDMEAVILVEFDPSAHGPAGVGPIERVVVVEDDSGPIAEITIKAVVTP